MHDRVAGRRSVRTARVAGFRSSGSSLALGGQDDVGQQQRSGHRPDATRVGADPARDLGDPGGDVPELRLDLHVYADSPPERYALVNMHKVREGEALPEGPRVVEITRDGVVLEWQGREFMLGRE